MWIGFEMWTGGPKGLKLTPRYLVPILMSSVVTAYGDKVRPRQAVLSILDTEKNALNAQ